MHPIYTIGLGSFLVRGPEIVDPVLQKQLFPNTSGTSYIGDTCDPIDIATKVITHALAKDYTKRPPTFISLTDQNNQSSNSNSFWIEGHRRVSGMMHNHLDNDRELAFLDADPELEMVIYNLIHSRQCPYGFYSAQVEGEYEGKLKSPQKQTAQLYLPEQDFQQALGLNSINPVNPVLMHHAPLVRGLMAIVKQMSQPALQTISHQSALLMFIGTTPTLQFLASANLTPAWSHSKIGVRFHLGAHHYCAYISDRGYIATTDRELSKTNRVIPEINITVPTHADGSPAYNQVHFTLETHCPQRNDYQMPHILTELVYGLTTFLDLLHPELATSQTQNIQSGFRIREIISYHPHSRLAELIHSHIFQKIEP